MVTKKSKKCSRHKMSESSPFAFKKPLQKKCKGFRGFCYFLFLFSLSIVILFIAGFINFIGNVNNTLPPSSLPKADGIIALTGGKNRVFEAFNLLKKNYGKKLFISGVHPKMDKKTLAHSNNFDEKLFLSSVDLGAEAENTLGNAQESAKWIKKNHYKTLYLVTSDYHMPRSLLEFETLIPDVHFIPYPVSYAPPAQSFKNYFLNRLRLLTLEYLKFLREKLRYLAFSPEKFL